MRMENLTEKLMENLTENLTKNLEENLEENSVDLHPLRSVSTGQRYKCVITAQTFMIYANC